MCFLQDHCSCYIHLIQEYVSGRPLLLYSVLLKLMLLVTINEYKYFQKILREKSQNQINYVILYPWSWNEKERNSSKAEVCYSCNEVKLTAYSHLLFRNLTGTVACLCPCNMSQMPYSSHYSVKSPFRFWLFHIQESLTTLFLSASVFIHFWATLL